MSNKYELYNKYARALALPLIAIASLLGATGCGSGPSHTPTVQVDPELAPYVSRFEAASVQNGNPTQVTDLSMNFGDVNDPGETGARGACEAVSGQTPVVTIAPDAWASSTDAEREQLVFHELGHCVLSLVHIAGITSAGIPKSIMDPVEIDGAIYSQYRDYYLQTLFNGSAQ